MKSLRNSLKTLAIVSTCSLLIAGCGSDDPAISADSTLPSVQASMKVDHVDAAGAAKLLEAADKPAIIDVRTSQEYAEGHIEGSTLIDFKAPDFEQKVAELDPNQTYLLHCRSGARSTSSLKVFEKLGFQHVIHLDGGFNAWKDAGLPGSQ